MADRGAPSEVAEKLLLLWAGADRDAAVRVLDTADARWWLAFDESARSHWDWALYSSWPTPGRGARPALDTLDLLLAGCHSDGRVREKMLPRLGALRSPAAATLLAIRT